MWKYLVMEGDSGLNKFFSGLPAGILVYVLNNPINSEKLKNTLPTLINLSASKSGTTFNQHSKPQPKKATWAALINGQVFQLSFLLCKH